jgi:orotidine-5'-phosphate decarboxylase
MTYDELYAQIKKKGSFLCVGLDTDLDKIPSCVKERNVTMSDAEAIFLFNKDIIDATVPYAVAYKVNTAFYEAAGWEGVMEMERTVQYIRDTYPGIFVIADAKRGDIGNTARQYAKAFFERMDSDAVTLSPYMGGDAILPFLSYKDKWVILLALTSNVTAVDFETLPTVEQNEYQYEPQLQVPMYERVIRKASQWGTKENTMFVVGATRPEQLARIRQICPDNFFLVPGVGAQGGTVEDVAKAGMNSHCGLLVNSSRGIIYADSTEKFAETAALKAEEMASEMRRFLEK